ncbi:putative ParB domain protein nuclease [Modestobacter italicus]|uniref:ParB domain protein nuclease n=1 Tax=Modestobacter italicus (strain DSM 44449 / CECT 9708 / BC 501) TaxID=2732864 RepID=I4ES96_MODI5|nr:ParB N-terminal domain-containing protein [Modestobacter marinus]CCH86259.1 putative ParB domain protein nuclease [Modestobacter marinus]
MTATSTPADSTRTESTATPQSIEGEPAMTTTTTVTAPNSGRESAPDEPSATGNAQRAGIEPRETGHVDPAGTGTTSAGMAEDSGRAHRLVWLDPRGLAVHPRNIRDDLGDLSGLADSIAAQGVLEVLTVIPHAAADGTPGHQLVAGHRRAAAAILAGVTAVPCVLRPDLAHDSADGDRAAQAVHVGAMLAENLHRRGLSAVEEARGVQAMLDLGVPLTKVAKSTGLGRKRVAKAAGVARLDGETAAAVAGAGLTLDQAAAVAVYAGDADTTAALIAAAGEGPGRFAHALTRAKQARAEAERATDLLAELTAAGRTVLDEDTGRARTRLADLEHDGRPLTADGHAGCPGAAVYVATTGWQGPQAVEVCTDPAGNGHRYRWTATALPVGAAGEDDREAAAAERRATIENNKAMAAANETRREWIKGLLQRKTAPKAALRFAIETMATDHRALSRWLSGQPNRAQDTAAADLGIDAPGQWWTTRDKPAPTLTSGEQVPDGRLAVALLAHVAGAIESGLHRQSWRNPGTGDARWLRFLASCGYTLADIERQIVDAANQHTDDPSPDPT